MEYLSLEELSNELSISVATAKNWLRLGKINFQKTKGNTKIINITFFKPFTYLIIYLFAFTYTIKLYFSKLKPSFVS